MVKVFYCDIFKQLNVDELVNKLPVIRKAFVDSVSNEKRKKQSVLVWLLLKYALKELFGNNNYEFRQNEDGSWGVLDDNVYISLSHSDNIVAVAVGDINCGVDIEKIQEKILKLKDKFCNQYGVNFDSVDDLTLTWTKKESLFKAKVGENYSYQKIFDAELNGYYLTVCADENAVEFQKVEINNII